MKKRISALWKNGIHYYLSDNLGSPLRVSGNEGTESRKESHAVLDYPIYGYDKFGNRWRHIAIMSLFWGEV